jgi:hypothetical protein
LLVGLDELAQGELDRVGDHALYGELPVEDFRVFDAWYCAMVADIVQVVGVEEPLVEEVGQGSFDVERVDAGEPDEPRVSFHMVVGSLEVFGQHLVWGRCRGKGVKAR